MAIAPVPSPNPAVQKPARRVHYPCSDNEPMGETDKHRNETLYLIEGLKAFFAGRPDVYVSGDNFVYYEEGDPRAQISPDTYVVFGVPMRERDSYFSWKENGRLPAVVFEVTSRATKNEDTGPKFERYEQILRVPEYFLFDPTGDYLRPFPLRGHRLGPDGRYVEIPPVNGRLHSEQLGLDLLIENGRLRLFDPVRGETLLTPFELAARTRSAEAEIARLRAELDALRRERDTN